MNIGTLTIEMAANVARLAQDMDRAQRIADQRSRAMAQAFGVATKAFAAIGGAVAVSQLLGSIRSVANVADSLAKLSQKTGVTVENLQKLQYHAELSGASSETLNTGMTRLARNMADTARGIGTARTAFATLGVSVTTSTGALKSSDQMLMEIADAMSRYRDGAGKAALAQEIFGKSGAELIPLMNGGAAAIRGSGDELKSYGAIVSEDVARASEQLNDNMSRLNRQFDGVKTTIASGLIPIFAEASDGLVAFGGSGGMAELATDVLATTLETVVVLGANVAYVFKGIGNEIGGLAAQAAAVATLDFSQAAAIGDMMKADAESARAEIDAFSARILSARELSGVMREARAGTADYAATVARLIEMQNTGKITADQFRTAVESLQPKAKGTAGGLNDLGGSGDRAGDAFKKLADAGLALAGNLMAVDGGLSADFAEKWDQLNAAWKSGAINVDQLAAAQALLLEQQPAIKKAVEATAKLQEDYAANVAAALGPIEEQARALERQVVTYGKTEGQIQRTIVARLEEAKAIATANGALPEHIKYLEREIEARKAIAAAADTLEARKVADTAAQAAADEWQRTADSIEQDITDALMRGFESGKGFGKNLRDTLINMFKTLVLRPLIQPVAQGASGAVSSMISPGGGGGINAGSLVNNIGGAAGVGNALGTAYANATGTGLDGLVSATGGWGTAPGTWGAGVGASVVPGLAAYGLAQQYGPVGGMVGAVGTTALGGALGMGAGAAAGGGLAGAGAALAAVPVWGWIAAAALAILGGMGPNKPTNYWQGAAIDTATGAVQKTGSYDPESRRYSPENRAVADQFGAYLGSLSQTLARITGETLEHEIRIGVGSKDKHFTLDGIKTELKRGSNEELIDLAAGTLVDMVYDKLTDAAKGVVDALREEGESIEGALIWVVDGLPELNKWLGRFGVAVLDINVEGVRAADALALLAGGVENLAALQGGYYDAFFTDAEKVLHMNADLSGALGELGLGMVNSRDGFRELVEAQDLNTEAGREAYVGLMALAPQMDQYLTTLAGQLDATDDAAAASVQYRAALEDHARASQDYVNRLLRLSQMLHGALDSMRIGTLADDRMRRSTAIAQLETAYAIARASGGRTLPDPDALAPALNRAMEPSAQLYGSFVDYARDFYTTANTITGLAALTDEQLSIEERTLAQLKDRAEIEDEYQKQNTDLANLNNALAAEQKTLLEQIRSLLDEQGLYATDKDPNKPIPGMLGVYEPLGADAQAQAQAFVRSLAGDGPITDDIKRQIYAAAVAQGGAIGITNATRLDEALGLPVGTSEQEIRRLGLPMFADGGYHTGGLRVVGERSWELEATGPARYWTPEQMLSMFAGGGAGGDAAEELRQFRAEMRAALGALAGTSHSAAKSLAQIVDDGVDVRVEA